MIILYTLVGDTHDLTKCRVASNLDTHRVPAYRMLFHQQYKFGALFGVFRSPLKHQLPKVEDEKCFCHENFRTFL